MVKDNLIHTAIPKDLLETMKKVLFDCENLNIFLNKKQAYLVVNEKSKRGKMSDVEIKEFIKGTRNLSKTTK